MSLLALMLFGCAAEDPASLAACDGGGESRIAVINTLRFARLDENDQTVGFDLDGLNSDQGDREGCGVQDYSDPRGNTGIDASFASLVPILELTEARAVEGLIANAIASGELLFTLEVGDLDDPGDDPCVDFSFGRGEGRPDLSSTGDFLAGQTFERSAAVQPVHFTDVPLLDNELQVRPFDTHIPITIFDVNLDFEVHDAAMSLTMDEDGRMHGYFGGGVDTQVILDIVTEQNVDAALEETVIALMATRADLAPDEDGVCHEISINFEFEAVSAFLFEE